jgi:hypothetical protein
MTGSIFISILPNLTSIVNSVFTVPLDSCLPQYGSGIVFSLVYSRPRIMSVCDILALGRDLLSQCDVGDCGASVVVVVVYSYSIHSNWSLTGPDTPSVSRRASYMAEDPPHLGHPS